MADPKAALGSTEIDILRYVGDHHPISVGDVAEFMAQASGQARTTILTTMERLRKKGYLSRKQVEGVYRYSLKIPKQDLLRGLVKTFVDGALGGSVSPFVAYLSEGCLMSEKDLGELTRLVRDLERQRKEGRKS
jgi:predicted transcriptional regulator